MIIWSGLGFLAFVLPIGAMGLTNVICVNFLPRSFDWLPLLAFVLSGFVLIVLGRKLNSRHQPAHHTMFWIRIEYWGIAIVALSVVGVVAATAFLLQA